MSYHCAKCPTRIQKLRRCREDREDFDTSDGNLWPMYVIKGGTGYGFCPGKATWDASAVLAYQTLTLMAETRQLLKAGGLEDQDEEVVFHMAWFIPKLKDLKRMTHLREIFGDGKASPSKPAPSKR